jgi:hypothetical protein
MAPQAYSHAVPTPCLAHHDEPREAQDDEQASQVQPLPLRVVADKQSNNVQMRPHASHSDAPACLIFRANAHTCRRRAESARRNTTSVARILSRTTTGVLSARRELLDGARMPPTVLEGTVGTVFLTMIRAQGTPWRPLCRLLSPSAGTQRSRAGEGEIGRRSEQDLPTE